MTAKAAPIVPAVSPKRVMSIRYGWPAGETAHARLS